MAKLDENDCPQRFEQHTEAFNKLKSMVDIKPKVIQDFATIHEKFPCFYMSTLLLQRFVSENLIFDHFYYFNQNIYFFAV